MRYILPAALMLLALPAHAAPWVIEPTSTLKFTGSQAGDAFTGEFTKFTPVVELDPAKPETGKITVTVDMASAIVKDDKDKTESMPQEEWFAIKQFPTATFTSKRITSLSSKQGGYVAEGDLSIRGVTKAVVLPFTLSEKDGKTHAEGSVQLDRKDFGVGQGQWKDDKWIAYPVNVTFHLIATPGK